MMMKDNLFLLMSDRPKERRVFTISESRPTESERDSKLSSVFCSLFHPMKEREEKLNKERERERARRRRRQR